MSDGSVNFNKLTFFQKVELAKENLSAQGKTSPSTADIVKEMVNLEKAAKADGSSLPDGFQIEHANARRASAYDDVTIMLYGTPEINRSAQKILEMLQKILDNDSLTQEAKTEATAILKEMLSLITASGKIPDGLINLVDELANSPIGQQELLYGTPEIDQRTNSLLNFFGRMSTNDAIPDDIKKAFMDILNNPENVGGGEKSAATLLIDTLMKLAEDPSISRDVLRAIADIINTMSQEGAFIDSANNNAELVTVIVTDDNISVEMSNIVQNLYDTPNINSEVFKKFYGFCQKIMASDLPQEIKEMVLELLQNPSDIGTAASSVNELVLNTIKNLISSGKLSDDEISKIIDIANSLGFDIEIPAGTDIPEMVYGTPDINPFINDPNVQVLLNFLDEFMNSDIIPDDIKTKMREILGNIGDASNEGTLVAEVIIDAVNKLLSENDISEEVAKEIENIINGLDFDNADKITIDGGYCLYDTPEIRNKKILIVVDIIGKLNSSTELPEDLKQDLLKLLSDILHELKNEEIASGISNIQSGLEGVDITGTTKTIMNKDDDIESKFPSDKYDIKAKISLDADRVLIIAKHK